MAASSTRHIEPLLPAAQDVTGAAALTGLGSSTVAGTRTRFAAADLTGTGTLTAAGARTRFGAAALTGLGSMTAAGNRISLGTAALTGTGTLTAVGTHAAIGTAALIGNGTLSTNGTRTRFGQAALTGTGTSTTAGTVSRDGAAALTGGGTLSATGTTTVTAAAHLTGTGTLTASFEELATAAPPGFVPAQQRRLRQQDQPKHVRARARLHGTSYVWALGMVLGPISPAVFTGRAHLTATSGLEASGRIVGHVTATAAMKFTPTLHHQATAILAGTLFSTSTRGRNATVGAADLIGYGTIKAAGFGQSGGLTDGQLDQELLALLL